MNKITRRRMFKKFQFNDNELHFGRCPVCNSRILFKNFGNIPVNIESNGYVFDDELNFFRIVGKCNNALCKWSSI